MTLCSTDALTGVTQYPHALYVYGYWSTLKPKLSHQHWAHWKQYRPDKQDQLFWTNDKIHTILSSNNTVSQHIGLYVTSMYRGGTVQDVKSSLLLVYSELLHKYHSQTVKIQKSSYLQDTAEYSNCNNVNFIVAAYICTLPERERGQ